MLTYLQRCITAAARFGLARADEVRGMVAVDGPRDLAIVLDVSPSMWFEDFPPNRIRAAQDASIELIDKRKQRSATSRIAVVTYGGTAKVLCPPIPCGQLNDAATLINSLEKCEATNFTAGLCTARECCQPIGLSKVEIVLLSDGQHNTGPSPIQISDELKEAGCIIRTIGIGIDKSTFDEQLLKNISSRDEFGEPRYRFITDRDGLIQHFGDIGGGLTL